MCFSTAYIKRTLIIDIGKDTPKMEQVHRKTLPWQRGAKFTIHKNMEAPVLLKS